MDVFLQILYTVLVLGFLILVHEFGHFIAAKIFKIKVNEFSIGMGPKLISVRKGKFSSFFTKKTEDETDDHTRYSLRLLPVGGYVSMEGEDADSENDAAFSKKPAWQRLIVVLAGGFMNLVTAFILTLIITSQSYVYTTQVAGFSDNATSSKYGLQAEDTIIELNGVKIQSYTDFSYAFQKSIGKESVTVKVMRNGSEVTLEEVVFPEIYMVSGEPVTEESEQKLAEEGKTASKMMYLDFSVFGSTMKIENLLPTTFSTMWSYLKNVYNTLFDMISGKLSVEYVSGPIGISSSIKQAADYGILYVFSLAALISVNLAAVNLMPLPALDGGRGAFLLFEALTKKKVNPKIEATVHAAGMVILLLLIALIAFKDVFFPVT